jgi:transcription-repair coupling factor (superfamily II helicase)
LGISRLDYGPQGGRLEFSADTRADPTRLIGLMQKQPQHYRLDGPQKLRLLSRTEDAQDRIRQSEQLLQALIPDA